MSYSPEAWKRVDQVLEAARVRLRPPLGWKEVALRAGLSAEGIRVIRRGLVEDPRPENLAKIETALGLPLGTITNVLRDPGFQVPVATPDPQPEPEPEPQNHYAEELQERYGLTPERAEAAAVMIRALQRGDGNSPDQSKKEA